MRWFSTKYKQNDTKDRTASFAQVEKRENIKSGEKHSTIFGKIAKFFADLKTVAFTGSYNDLEDKPSSFPPSSHTHTKSNITDFPSSMPASDVPAWAKAASKPSYNWSEIGSKPSIPAAVRVKGNAESSYRTGDVNLTPANIGAAASNHSHNYLPLSGGTLTGTLLLQHIKNSTGDRVYIEKGEIGRMAFMPDTSNSCYNFMGVGITMTNNKPNLECLQFKQFSGDYGLYIMPTKNKSGAVGDDGTMFLKMGAVNFYNSSGVITSSDRNKKMNFEEITLDFAEKIVEGLKPTSYMYKEGTSGRRHYGLVAQDVEELLEELGISTESFAPLVKTWPQKTIMHKTIDENEISELVTDYDAEPKYYLRYEGFTGIIIRYIQGLKTENKQQQEKIEDLEKRLAKLEKIVFQQTS